MILPPLKYMQVRVSGTTPLKAGFHPPQRTQRSECNERNWWLSQLGSVPAAYAVVAGGCDWPLLPAVGLSNNDVIVLRALRQFRQLRNFCYVSYVPYVPYAACVALDGNPA